MMIQINTLSDSGRNVRKNRKSRRFRIHVYISTRWRQYKLNLHAGNTEKQIPTRRLRKIILWTRRRKVYSWILKGHAHSVWNKIGFAYLKRINIYNQVYVNMVNQFLWLLTLLIIIGTACVHFHLHIVLTCSALLIISHLAHAYNRKTEYLHVLNRTLVRIEIWR